MACTYAFDVEKDEYGKLRCFCSLDATHVIGLKYDPELAKDGRSPDQCMRPDYALKQNAEDDVYCMAMQGGFRQYECPTCKVWVEPGMYEEPKCSKCGKEVDETWYMRRGPSISTSEKATKLRKLGLIY
jgi:hypothetical protein